VDGPEGTCGYSLLFCNNLGLSVSMDNFFSFFHDKKIISFKKLFVFFIDT
jgi:hypothetical protein